jgi:hypothetical protein
MTSVPFCRVLPVLAMIGSVSACGGGQSTPSEVPASTDTTAPSETPAGSPTEPTTEPSSTPADDTGGEGSHTMPDGGTMPGHHHSE